MDASASPDIATENGNVGDAQARGTTFDALDQVLRTSGPAAVLDQLIRRLTERGEARALLDALLLSARHDLGLPLIQTGDLSELADPARELYEERYVAAIRTVGALLLDAGDIPGAWPYFRAIGETEPVSSAIDAYTPSGDEERLGAIIEVAFNQKANPRRGFELILDQYGTCSAISAFEHLPGDEATRVSAADRLVRRLHDDLVANLRAEVAQRGQPLPKEGTPIAGLIDGRPWLFSDDAYHIDVSHLGAIVRIAPLLKDSATIALALELTDYGRNLSPRHRSEGEPPFDDHYEDHARYLGALLGRDAEAAIGHFRGKLASLDLGSPERSYSAQILVGLLLRLDRLDEAIDVSAENLAGTREHSLICPSVAQLCQRAGHHERMARIAREQGDLVHYAAAILQAAPKADGRS